MALTLPQLDDRRWGDLVEEARGLLVSLAPALTDHNPSGPVITLTELFAYVTDILLYRLNTVTDANRIAFLRLLNGPDWPAPSSREAIDGEVRRTVLTLRSVDRAATPADYEALARAADPAGGVARAHCVTGYDLSLADPVQRAVPRPGHVSVVIVPGRDADLATLIPLVAAWLEPRRLLGTVLHVSGPRLLPLRVVLTVNLLHDAIDSVVQARVVQALTQFFTPVGGADGPGWPFGRSVHVSQIYRLVDALPGVDFVTRTPRADGQGLQDELAVPPQLAARLQRNDAGELVSVALAPGELVQAQVGVDDIGVRRAGAAS